MSHAGKTTNASELSEKTGAVSYIIISSQDILHFSKLDCLKHKLGTK